MLNLLEAIHIFLGLTAIGAGISVCARMVAGHPFEMWIPHFLKFSVTAAAVGLIISIDHTSLTQWLTVFGVYVSAFAVFAWRKFNLSENWGAALVLNTMCVLCLDTVIAIAHIFKFLAVCNGSRSSLPDGPYAALIVADVLLFAALSTIAVKKIHPTPSEPMVKKVAQ